MHAYIYTKLTEVPMTMVSPSDKWARQKCPNCLPIPNDEILDWSKLKAFADDKLNVIEKLEFVLGRVENIVGKEENAALSPFPTMFSKGI